MVGQNVAGGRQYLLQQLLMIADDSLDQPSGRLSFITIFFSFSNISFFFFKLIKSGRTQRGLQPIFGPTFESTTHFQISALSGVVIRAVYEAQLIAPDI